MQAQERFVLTEMTLKVKEGEKRARLGQAMPAPRRSSWLRTLLVTFVHTLGL